MGAMADIDPERKRRNVILAWVHVALAAAILAGFVYAQMHR
ncbi:MAG TPA: hypothetical protein VFB36_06650 [Nevskiaceae bacterium]|nr:hypothetical protein [Nevskiaceae bacterium]